MSLSVGIVGLPNVGKSTLFNALLRKQQALAANYPFATIEPNTGIVEVPDKRLAELAGVVEKNLNLSSGSVPLRKASIEFVDIAGLVAGASKGEGLGNQFLANIRETELICHVMRAFEDGDVVLTGKLDPVEDLQTIRTELILKDIETLEKQDKALRKERSKDLSEARDKAMAVLSSGKMISSVVWPELQKDWLDSLSLLTAKPEIFVVNVAENRISQEKEIQQSFAKTLETNPENIAVISAKIEAELADLEPEDQVLFMQDLGLTESGIERMARVAYHKLGLISFLTAGEIEVRAWTIKKGASAPEAAGAIHTDFTKKFIKAEVIGWREFIEFGGWKGARDKGKARTEGREYVMKDGEVVDFKIGA